jgi:hypothetical protein
MHQLYSLYSSRTILSKLLDRYGEVDSIKENIPTKTTKGKLQKRTTTDLPNIKNYSDLYESNYTVQELKDIYKANNIYCSKGNKPELTLRLFTYFKLSTSAIVIQRMFRGSIQRKYTRLHGPVFTHKSICNNNTDFFTMDEITELKYGVLFSYRDPDGFVYGFDIHSLYKLVITSKNSQVIVNPYNRAVIPSSVIENVSSFLKLTLILTGHNVVLTLKNAHIEKQVVSIENRTIELFHAMDSLGNYTTPSWFLSLSPMNLLRFTRELTDIWEYRLNIPLETKREICPPDGNIFSNIQRSTLISFLNNDIDILRHHILNVMEKLVNTGINTDAKLLGSYYVLGALSIVNPQILISTPWLQSFSGY